MNLGVSDLIIAAIITGISGFVGAWYGGKLVSDTQKMITEQESERQRMSVTAAFYGEIYSILRLIEMRDFERILMNALSYIKENKKYPVYDSFLRMKFDVFYLVYKNHIQDIGKMAPETAVNITNFYIAMFSLLEDATAAPGAVMDSATQICQTTLGSDVNRTYVRNLATLIKSDYILLYELIDTGKKICESLSKDLGIEYIPVFKDIKTPYELKEQLDIDYPDGFWDEEAMYEHLIASNGK